MLVETYVLFEVIFMGFFVLSFYEKHELLWALTLVLGGLQMATSYFLETIGYTYDIALGAYKMTSYVTSSPYLMGINMAFFSLALILALFDIIDKYKDQVPHKDPKLKF